MTKHLYIHIPFCSNICWFCDFKRIKTNDYEIKKKYVFKIIDQIKKESIINQYETIYLGGGTPNYLDNDLLDYLLSFLNNYLNKNVEFEFSIECNPEFLNENQIKIFKKNNVNRVSIGVQSLNEQILKSINRQHKNQDVYNAIYLLKKYGIYNINCDFIYNLKNSNLSDLKQIFDFIKQNKIPHISFYALEIKQNSILNKQKYKLDLINEELQLIYIKKMFKKLNYKRYEISNWCLNNSYKCKHNLAYWNFNDWKAIGFGAYGFEQNEYYFYEGKILDFRKNINFLSKSDFYKNKFIMMLRKTDGIDLKNESNKIMFEFLKDKLKNFYIKNERLFANSIDCLNDTIIDLID